jgi:hypothetical protein
MKKQKKFGRKLLLNKETIGRLTSDYTKKVVAGAVTYDNCPSIRRTKCDWTECLVCPCEYPITPPPSFPC